MAVSPADVERELAAVSSAASARMTELSTEIWTLNTRDIPELRGDEVIENLHRVSVADNVATVFRALELGIAPEGADPPAAAVEYAKRLAQRGVPIVALVRAYRIGHWLFLLRCIEEVGERDLPPALATAVTKRLIDTTFQYIDRVSGVLIAIYQREREQSLLTVNTARGARVREILANAAVDLEAAEAGLHYRLTQHHLGVVAWVTDSAELDPALSRLDRLASHTARALAAPREPLFVPRDDAMAWIWLPLNRDTATTPDVLADAFDNDDTGVRIAAGEPGYGIAGFRQTHQQAIRAQEVALAARPGGRLTTFAEVGAISLLCSDMPLARSWIWTTLNDLSLDDETHARLRETLRVFLLTGSYAATAERLLLHKNSVAYRIHKAEEALGAPLAERRADIELALRACYHLGQAVLQFPEPR